MTGTDSDCVGLPGDGLCECSTIGLRCTTIPHGVQVRYTTAHHGLGVRCTAIPYGVGLGCTNAQHSVGVHPTWCRCNMYTCPTR